MELAEEVRESNRRLTQAIDNLGQKFDNLSQKFDNLGQRFDSLRVEIAKDLGAINANLESFKARAESELGVAKWAAKVLTPAVIGLIGFGFGGAWYLAKVDSRLDELVKQTAHLEVRRSQPPAPTSSPAPVEPKPIPNTMSPPSKAVLPPT